MKVQLTTFISLWLLILPTIVFGQLKVLWPNGNETLTPGDTIPIVWANAIDSIPTTIEFSSNGGEQWEYIGSGTTGERFLWCVPPIISGNCLIRVRQESASNIKPQLLHQLFTDSGAITTVQFSPDGTLLATTGWDRIVRLWDVKTGKVLRKFSDYTNSVLSVCFSPDGSTLATTSLDRTIHVRDIYSGVLKHLFTTNDILWSAAYSPDGETLAVSNDDGSILMWNAQSGDSMTSFRIHNESIRNLSYADSGRLILTSSTDRTASIIDAKTHDLLQFFSHVSVEQDSEEARRRKVVNGIQLTKDKSIAVTCGFNGLVKFWDAKTGALVASREYHHGNYVSSIAISPNQQWLISVGYDSTIQIIDMKSHESIFTIHSDKGRVVYVKFSPDGHLFAIGHWDKTITLWSLGSMPEDVSDESWTISEDRSLGSEHSYYKANE